MAWYAYCISEKQAFPELMRHRKPIAMESVTGVFDNQVFLYPASDLAVIVTEFDPAEAIPPRAAVDHAKVIAECFKAATVLPFRFGTTFADDEALRRSVRSNQRQFLSSIDHLRGKAEMHLKVLVDDGCAEKAGRKTAAFVAHSAGKEYLSRLREVATRQRERQTKARAVSVQMHRMFAPLDQEISCRRTEAGKMVLDIAHLIDHRGIERYQNKYSSASTLIKDFRMQLSGPWPPYHFTQRIGRTGAAAYRQAVPA